MFVLAHSKTSLKCSQIKDVWKTSLVFRFVDKKFTFMELFWLCFLTLFNGMAVQCLLSRTIFNSGKNNVIWIIVLVLVVTQVRTLVNRVLTFHNSSRNRSMNAWIPKRTFEFNSKVIFRIYIHSLNFFYHVFKIILEIFHGTCIFKILLK